MEAKRKEKEAQLLISGLQADIEALQAQVKMKWNFNFFFQRLSDAATVKKGAINNTGGVRILAIMI